MKFVSLLYINGLILIFPLFFLSGNKVSGQSSTTDSLTLLLEKSDDEGKAGIYLKLSEEYLRLKDGLNAYENAQKAYEFSKINGLDNITAEALNISATLNRRRDPPKAIEYWEEALMIRRKTEDKKQIMEICNKLAEMHSLSNPDKSLTLGREALVLSKELNDSVNQADAYNVLGQANFTRGFYNDALEAWEQALVLYTKLKYRNERGLILVNIGIIYKSWGEYEKALEYYQENLKLQEEIGNTFGIAIALNNIANIHFYMGMDMDKALQNYQKSLELFKQVENMQYIADTYNNIGLVYREKKDMGEALNNYNRALRIFKDINNKSGIAKSQNLIGGIYLEGGNYEDALQFSKNALNLNKEIGNRKEVASNLWDIGKVYFKWGKYEQALDYYNQSLKINNELGHKKEVYEIYKNISEVYIKQERYHDALNYFMRYNELKDSSLNEDYIKQISELETKYETDRKERELELQKTELARNKAESERNLAELAKRNAEVKRQRVLIYSFVFGLIMILVFSSLLYKQFREKQRANILLEAQNTEIKELFSRIFQQNKEITDSIHYARRIQTAILPPVKILEEKLEDHFILYLPRDIVSGDYYWFTERNGRTIVTAADCTGHGVPGAFMSMLGVSFLNEIVNKKNITKPSDILDNLRTNIVESLHQTGKEGEAQDGMDMAIVSIDHKNMLLEYAGAYNPLYLVRNNELTEIKADKMPIGIHSVRTDSFTNNEIQVHKGDSLYIFSDGYIDQFGGEKGKKFMAGQFKKVLEDIHLKDFSEQAEILSQTLKQWKGNIDQIDDILVIGLKI